MILLIKSFLKFKEKWSLKNGLLYKILELASYINLYFNLLDSSSIISFSWLDSSSRFIDQK